MYQRSYRGRNKANILIQNKNRYQKLKYEVLSYYSSGEIKCKWCGFNDIRALVIDHIGNDGSSNRKTLMSSSIYAYLKKNDFPNGFQVLCHNCNWIKEVSRKLTSRDFLIEQEIGEL